MRIVDGVYQTSGSMFGTNSNTYCLDTSDGLVLIDAGFSEKQYQIMREQRRKDSLARKRLQELFITHCHFDHAGNGWLLQKEGARVCMGEKDAEAVSKGGARVLEERFGRKFHCYTPALIVKDGQSFDYGNVRLTVLEHPGHTEGTISILAEGRSGKILFTGDLFTLKPCTPDDEIQIEIIRPGSPDYNEEKNLETLRRLRELPPVDMVAPGHGSIWLGDSRELFETLYRTAKG
ncbi:MAG TPA: MBL fold metallo-hydrolase [Candidatus Merdisoma faecalis]|nr:MBL fold metallo-hydrolase [Candidatus Merdisoma faecalis]